jgi:hypothetical protein
MASNTCQALCSGDEVSAQMVAQIQSLQVQASSGREAALLRDTMVGGAT